jgi:ABC-type dipeptide/oligopeptide/nickel transport system permease subunit
VVIVLLIVVAALAPLIAPYDPLALNPGARLARPSTTYLMGGDELGRDVFSRVLYGARISLKVGIIAVAIGVSLGTLIGLITGYVGGLLDMIGQRVIDAIIAFPGLLLALIVASTLGSSITNTMIAIGVVLVPASTRVVRGSVLSVKNLQYIEAAESTGATQLRVIARHIAPNIFAPVIVIASVTLGNAVIIEASLSFLGLGTPPPDPSWGGMLSGASQQYLIIAPWLTIFPGLAITILVMAFNLLGDALRDIFDPRLRGTQ